MHASNDSREAFDAIDWTALDIAAVYAFYQSINRPTSERALLVAPVDPAKRDEWRRRCVADLAAMQKRACPSCAA